VATLFAAWKEWADLNGHRPGNSATFGRNLRAAVPMLRMTQPRDGDTRERMYVGITLRPACNEEERVPPRAEGAGDDLERDGTRDIPLRPQLCSACGERSAGPGGILCEECFRRIGEAAR
jgi:hypothetical protein